MIEDVALRPQASLGFENLPRLLGQPERLARAVLQLATSDVLRALRSPAQNGEPYGRRVLHRSAEGEVMLASWTGREACAPHDHGSSRGSVFVVEGAFLETWYRVERGLFRSFARREYGPGALIAIDRELIHAMEPVGPGLTLHVYAPPISCMRVFDPGHNEALTVADDCGAWIPSDVRLVTARSCLGALTRGERT
jgi:cysteine dioxygenase